MIVSTLLYIEWIRCEYAMWINMLYNLYYAKEAMDSLNKSELREIRGIKFERKSKESIRMEKGFGDGENSERVMVPERERYSKIIKMYKNV